MKPSYFLLPFLMAGLAAAAPAPSQELKKNEHDKLARAIEGYIEAMNEEEGISDATEKVHEALGKVRKKRKGEDPLKLVKDLQQAFYLAGSYDGKKGRGKAVELESDRGIQTSDGLLTYHLRAPSKYSAKSGPYALVVTVPDVGQAADTHLMEDWSDPAVVDSAIFVAVNMPSKVEEWNEVIVGSSRSVGGVGAAMSTVSAVAKQYAVDMDRVFIAGKGAGVATAATTASLFPHVFAGVIGRSGDLPEALSTENFSNLPMYVAGGGAFATAFQEAATTAGMSNFTLQPDGNEQAAWEWIAAQARVAHPAEFRLRPAAPIARSAYWVQLEGIEPGKSVLEAKIDRDTNTITLDGTNISAVTVYFNDILVDMDRSVTVICNGTTHEDVIPRNVNFMLGNAYRNGDSGRIYSGQKRYDMPARVAEGG